ncbi:4-hydroxylaminobenzoate lyase [Polynucleobacter kasalickyi]|nr:DUF4863 family protein [Polynucleobacter kasalickyi]
MNQVDFRLQLSELTQLIGLRALDQHLEQWLNEEYGYTTAWYQKMKNVCLAGIDQGWLCNREGGGIRYGRVFKPADDLAGFSVDVVDMENIAGPHHVHPLGEIDLIMPIDDGALFDGHAAGWMVTAAGSAHEPTVSNGRALVLYLLPEGQIQFKEKNIS